MSRKFTIVGLGEVLWDLLPSGRQIGGAPTNFAYISTLLGDRGIVASRLGKDAPGSEAIDRLEALNLNTFYLQHEPSHPTGTVKVFVNRQGQPRFVIRKSVAWDFLGWTAGWEQLARKADAVCFGTLAQRTPQSRATITKFLRTTRGIRTFDVNLRQKFYSADVMRESMRMANIVKMNDAELPVILELLGLPSTKHEPAARQLLDFGPVLVCVTRGSRGSLLMDRRRTVDHPGFSVRVVDTVGSGDAFTAGLVHEYLRGASLTKMSDAANRMGSWVARQAGGTPVIARRALQKQLARLSLND